MSQVIIVDDEPDIANVLGELLGEEGLDVRVVHDGRQALEAMVERLPDLLITDLMMPRMDGHTLIREMRGNAALRHIPIVVMSAGLLDKSLLAPDIRFVPKPFELSEMFDRVFEMLAKRGGSR
ncbi:response regulator [Cystobacter fuscus DSM 2262]|uniref:Response regulator n=1 Tax=Cystobacter fuscus (strain ATCC 25194 / DSM 2262 / NBRC 100088 / M29) TaxID=1242864 RepID=S9PGK2_CYSF2|nr:response regulator [Cystobacter fuscus]EPX62186.1 response regulator [Cystobacter fuscus DSM 2262]